MRWPKLLLWLVPLLMLTCAVVMQSRVSAVQRPRPTVNHALHQQRDLLCGDCHDPEETGEPALPSPETCFECHENLEEEGDRVQAYFREMRKKDGSYAFRRPSYMGDLIVDHRGHPEHEVSCEACHGEPTDQAFARPAPLDFMTSCIECHEKRAAPADCATCHTETRSDVKPAAHGAADFLAVHGRQAPAGWTKGEGGSCAICHDVPKDCTSCHEQTKPKSHKEGQFRYLHGRGETDALDTVFAETSCALCHKEQSCVTCHQRTEPVSHRGNWGTGNQAHCITCHEPLNSTGCFACHKNTLGHLSATPLPPGLPHSAATDCRTCHTVIQHFDDGGSCRRCHR